MPWSRFGTVHWRDGLLGERRGVWAEDADADIAGRGGVAIGGAKRLCRSEVLIRGASREQAGRAGRADWPEQQTSVDDCLLQPFVFGLVAADDELGAAGKDEVTPELEKLQFRSVAKLAARLDIAQLVAEELFREETAAGR